MATQYYDTQSNLCSIPITTDEYQRAKNEYITMLKRYEKLKDIRTLDTNETEIQELLINMAQKRLEMDHLRHTN